jgi:hypothetical protein
MDAKWTTLATAVGDFARKAQIAEPILRNVERGTGEGSQFVQRFHNLVLRDGTAEQSEAEDWMRNHLMVIVRFLLLDVVTTLDAIRDSANTALSAIAPCLVGWDPEAGGDVRSLRIAYDLHARLTDEIDPENLALQSALTDLHGASVLAAAIGRLAAIVGTWTPPPPEG